MADFLHIYISPAEGVTIKQIEGKLDLALDWYRYATGLYIVHTTSGVDKWKARLIDLVKPRGRLLIVKLDISQRQGWMNKGFWEWLREKSTSPKGPTTD
jgi:hypothetical protein